MKTKIILILLTALFSLTRLQASHVIQGQYRERLISLYNTEFVNDLDTLIQAVVKYRFAKDFAPADQKFDVQNEYQQQVKWFDHFIKTLAVNAGIHYQSMTQEIDNYFNNHPDYKVKLDFQLKTPKDYNTLSPEAQQQFAHYHAFTQGGERAGPALTDFRLLNLAIITNFLNKYADKISSQSNTDHNPHKKLIHDDL